MSDSDKNTSPEWIPPTVEELHALLPQYEISAVLGRGGMGAVYQGRQTKLKRNVAIKVLPESLGSSEDDDDPNQFVERFKLEAQSMANLDHPAILSVHDFGETSDGQLYLVMEFIDGMDIKAYLNHHGGKLLHEHAIAITAHVLDALQYAHDHGVIHRDIKPANVLINSEGRVKIADFGLAKRLTRSEGDESESVDGLTSANMVMGTPHFVAPEALNFDGNPDARADLYAVGVMFYQMLTGRLPRGNFELPSELLPDLDPRFDGVVSRALQANPDNRYGSATEFRIDLDGLLSRPVPKPSNTQPAKIPAAPLRTEVPVKSRLPYPRPKPAERKKSKAPLVVGLALGAALVIGVGIYAMKRSNSGEEPGVEQTKAPSQPETESAFVPPPTPRPPVDPTPPPPVVMPSDEDKKDDPPVNPSPDPIPEPKPDLASIPGLQPRLALYLKARREQVGELAGKYLGGLESRLNQAANAGNLKMARAFEQEKSRVTGLQRALGEPPADFLAAVEQPATLSGLPASTPASVTALRVTWDTERQKIRDDFNSRLSQALQELEADLTKAHEFDHAETIVAYRESLPISGASSVSPKRAGSVSSAPVGATKDRPFENSLGMKFVPVPITGGPTEGERVLFSIWETRVKDYATFIKEDGRRSWATVEFAQGDDHPAVMVSWEDAMAFCAWLTEEERKKGGLGEDEIYRLPSDHEWSCAVEIGKREDAGATPQANDSRIKDVYPWGLEWPPPPGAGNYYGEEVRKNPLPADRGEPIKDYDDGYDRTSPVGSFVANVFGLYDLGGNASEWCQDRYAAGQERRASRGGAYRSASKAQTISSKRYLAPVTYFNVGLGFRVVIGTAGR